VSPDPQVIDTIKRVAARHGIDPAVALAIAERESSFNVHGGSGSPYSSAYGLFQLLRSERAQYGGSSSEPEEQSESWANYIEPHRQHMAKVLGREPTGPELYMSHLIGPGRAARIVSGQIDPNTPISDVMTQRELAANPFMVRAGTAGGLASSVMSDVGRRMQKYGGDGDSQGDTPKSRPFNFSDFGEAVDMPDAPQSQPLVSGQSPGGSSYAAFGEPVGI
jgi:hypothetical protein